MGIGPMTEAERYRFDLHGFLVRRGVLGPGDVAALNAAVDVLDLPPAGSDIGSQRFSDFLPVARRFRDLIDHPAVLEIVREICGPNVRLDHAYGIVMTRGTAGLGLHGGGSPYDPAQHYRVDAGRIRTGLVAAQWALVDHPPGGGGFMCIPGSHKSGFQLPATFDRELAVLVPLGAGDVVVFTEALTHGTLPWQGAADRRSLLYKYSPGNSAYSHAQWPADLVAACTDRQRLLLQPPSVGGHRPVVP
ncbi:MAG: phytanoyl-CoA dioxygenase family protein [Ilumatobacteraceae bacterium]